MSKCLQGKNKPLASSLCTTAPDLAGAAGTPGRFGPVFLFSPGSHGELNL